MQTPSSIPSQAKGAKQGQTRHQIFWKQTGLSTCLSHAAANKMQEVHVSGTVCTFYSNRHSDDNPQKKVFPHAQVCTYKALHKGPVPKTFCTNHLYTQSHFHKECDTNNVLLCPKNPWHKQPFSRVTFYTLHKAFPTTILLTHTRFHKPPTISRQTTSLFSKQKLQKLS